MHRLGAFRTLVLRTKVQINRKTQESLQAITILFPFKSKYKMYKQMLMRTRHSSTLLKCSPSSLLLLKDHSSAYLNFVEDNFAQHKLTSTFL